MRLTSPRMSLTHAPCLVLPMLAVSLCASEGQCSHNNEPWASKICSQRSIEWQRQSRAAEQTQKQAAPQAPQRKWQPPQPLRRLRPAALVHPCSRICCCSTRRCRAPPPSALLASAISVPPGHRKWLSYAEGDRFWRSSGRMRPARWILSRRNMRSESFAVWRRSVSSVRSAAQRSTEQHESSRAAGSRTAKQRQAKWQQTCSGAMLRCAGLRCGCGTAQRLLPECVRRRCGCRVR
jgi:hypothetical protein